MFGVLAWNWISLRESDVKFTLQEIGIDVFFWDQIDKDPDLFDMISGFLDKWVGLVGIMDFDGETLLSMDIVVNKFTNKFATTE